jgi:hypothetical protein
MKTRADVIRHLEVIESKRPKLNKEDKGIPIDEDAQPLWESIWLGVENFVGGENSAQVEKLIYKALGDSIAYKATHIRKTITLNDIERTRELLEKEGIPL